MPRYRFSEFILSPRRRILVRNGRELPLIPRYFDLLVFLIERRTEAVHRREIFDRIWSDVVVSDSALSQAIRTIRRVLGDDSREPIFVRTVSRHGYRFVFGDVIEENDDGDWPNDQPAIQAPATTPEALADPFEPLLQRITLRARAEPRGGSTGSRRVAARARNDRGDKASWHSSTSRLRARAAQRHALGCGGGRPGPDSWRTCTLRHRLGARRSQVAPSGCVCLSPLGRRISRRRAGGRRRWRRRRAASRRRTIEHRVVRPCAGVSGYRRLLWCCWRSGCRCGTVRRRIGCALASSFCTGHRRRTWRRRRRLYCAVTGSMEPRNAGRGERGRSRRARRTRDWRSCGAGLQPEHATCRRRARCTSRP